MVKKARSKKSIPVKIKEKPDKVNWKKIIAILSLISIFVATVGFSIIGDKNQTVDNMREKLSDSEQVAENGFYDLKDSIKEYDKAMLMRNHIDILSNINAKAALIINRKTELIGILKNSVSMVYAIAVKLPDENAQKEWRDLDSYNELFPVYLKYLMKAELRIKNAQKDNILEKQRIDNISNSLRDWSIGLIVLNSTGLFLGVLASLFQTAEVGTQD